MRKPFDEMKEAEENHESQYFDDHDEKKNSAPFFDAAKELSNQNEQSEAEVGLLKKAKQTSGQNIDDLDLDLDIELPDIDPADVNLDDDLSD